MNFSIILRPFGARMTECYMTLPRPNASLYPAPNMIIKFLSESRVHLDLDIDLV